MYIQMQQAELADPDPLVRARAQTKFPKKFRIFRHSALHRDWVRIPSGSYFLIYPDLIIDPGFS